QGSLRAFFLKGNGGPIAVVTGTVCQRTLFLETMGYLPEFARHSPGKYLLLRVFESCCKEQLTTVDYGFGGAEYKRVYGTKCWNEATLRLYGHGARPAVARLIHTTSVAASELVARTLGKMGLHNRLKTKWRKRLARGH
ncbi:unnamed protein product, partial [marine sediment metagenome]